MATAPLTAPSAVDPPRLSISNPFTLLRRFRDDPLGLAAEAHELGDVVALDSLGTRLYLVFSPDGAKHVLQDNHRNYWKGRIFSRLRRFSGNGIILSEGEFWRRQRKLSNPAFRRPRLLAMADTMVRTADEMVGRWEKRGPDEPFDLQWETSRFALDVATRGLLGVEELEESEWLRETMHVAFDYANTMFNQLAPLPIWVPTARNRRMQREMRKLHEMLGRIIAEHREAGGDDLLGMLLDARDDETPGGMSDAELRDELITFITAGHETSGVTLAWTFHLLGEHPEAWQRLRDEVGSVLGGRPARAEDVDALVWTRAAIEEALRLRPPAWSIPRESLEEDEIAGFRIAPKSAVLISAYKIHRHPDFWDDPERFDPARFLPENSAGRHPLAYLPFGAGPRKCIGVHFAMLELILAVATIAQRVRLEPVEGRPVVEHPIFTLRARDGVWMRARPLD